MKPSPFVAALVLAIVGCSSVDGLADDDAAEASESAATSRSSFDVDLDANGPIELESVISARWAVPSAGLVNLNHPTARAAGLRNESTPIVLSVHVVRHPSRGVWVVDTGVPRTWSAGAKANVEGLVLGKLLESVEGVAPLADIVARQDAPLAGVFFTHMHIDHVLGLPDVPKGTPIYAGPHETEIPLLERAVEGRTFDRLLAGHDLRAFDMKKARPLGPARTPAIDVFGDGSFFALYAPGHTRGSMAYVARTTKGPVLLTGDSSHTIWGFENDVEPGFFTADGEENRASLAMLRALAKAHPKMRVVVGHEIDGNGTGIKPRG
jgi:N-acyl homoserine lactone hydrolase